MGASLPMSIASLVHSPEDRRGQPRAADPEPFPIDRRGRARLPFAREMSRRQALVALLGATILSAAVRVAVTRGLSLDEIRDLDAARVPFGTLISHLIHGGVYAPLHPVLLWCAIRIFGDGNTAVRLPSLLAGIALVPAVAWLAAEVYDRRTATLAGLLACLAPALVWYGQEASPYALVTLFGTLAVIGAVRAARHGRPADWALHTVAAALTVWSDWSGLPVVLATEIVLLIAYLDLRRDQPQARRFLTGWGLASVALAIQIVPLLLLLASELHNGGGFAGVFGVSASGVSFYTTVSNASWLLFGFHPSAVTSTLSAVWPLAMLACLTMVGRGVARASWTLLLCALLPGLTLLIVGLFVPGAFDVRFVLVSAPFLVILFARLAAAWPRSTTGRVLVAAAMLLILAGALIDQQIDSGNPRLDDYGAALATVRREAGPGATVLYEPADLRLVLQRFDPQLEARPLTHQLPTPTRHGSVFVVTSFQNDPAALALRNREIGALRATSHLIGYRSLPGVQVWRFQGARSFR